MENCEKFYKFFTQHCLKTVVFAFNSLKINGSSKNDHFLAENCKACSQLLPCCNCKLQPVRNITEIKKYFIVHDERKSVALIITKPDSLK